MNTLKRVVVVLATLGLLAGPSRATAREYFPYRLFELAAAADLVVTGKIADLRLGPPHPYEPSSPPGRFRLEVESVIAGKAPEGPLYVGCFEDWMCARRWQPYALGQRVLLFLTAPDKGATDYHILSAGGEGEMPLIDQAVFTRGVSVETYEPARREFAGQKEVAMLIPLSELTEAVRAFRETYTWERKESVWLPRKFRPRVSKEHAEAFSKTSKTAKHLHQEVLASQARENAGSSPR